MTHKWSRYSLTSENLGIYEEIFENIHIVDCHAHVGLDADGRRMTADRIIKLMNATNINRSVIFPLNDPRDPREFNVGNDEILLASKVYKDRFVPFFRLNPKAAWKKEFNLRVEQGFKGVKLHPRSQHFNLTNANAMKIYGECADNNLVVLIHAGMGMEGMAEDIQKIMKKFSKLKMILGHAGFVDLDNVIKKVGENERILFDTSSLRLFDLYDLLRNVDYKRISFGSDAPYYDVDWALEGVVDTAITLGKTANQIRKILGENVIKWFK